MHIFLKCIFKHLKEKKKSKSQPQSKVKLRISRTEAKLNVSDPAALTGLQWDVAVDLRHGNGKGAWLSCSCVLMGNKCALCDILDTVGEGESGVI